MPRVTAFRGLRYNLGQVGALQDVVAPPYDVINPALHSQLYQRHWANIVRLILNRSEPSDGEESRYQRAARYLKTWRSDGVLVRENDPALYVYTQRFQWEHEVFERHAVIAAIQLTRFGEGDVYPHEQTHPKAKTDRLRLIKACQANLSPVFGLYPDRSNDVSRLLSSTVNCVAGSTCTDEDGVEHTIWPVTEIELLHEVASLLADKPLFIADGHHRYETACDYRDHLKALGRLTADHPANSVMGALVSMQDAGLKILPTLRLFRGIPELNMEEMVRRLETCFLCEPCRPGIEGAHDAWRQMSLDHDQETLALYVKRSEQWLLCKAMESATGRLQELEPMKSTQWCSLGVSLLHRLVVDELLGVSDCPKPVYVHRVEEVVEALHGRGSRSEDDEGTPYSFAALVQPATLEHVQAISLQGERMPAKSTYFFPKLLSGLVINPLDGT